MVSRPGFGSRANVTKFGMLRSLNNTIWQQGCQVGFKWARLAPGGTNLSLFKDMFSFSSLLRELKCIEIRS